MALLGAVALLVALLYRAPPTEDASLASVMRGPAGGEPATNRIAAPRASDRQVVAIEARDLDAPKRRPANVSGRVVDRFGVPQPGLEVTLESGEAGVLASVSSDDAGRYRIADAPLSARAFVLVGVRWPLGPPLRSGEERVVDLIADDTREVVGIVLDAAGDPMPDAVVTLEAMHLDRQDHTLSDDDGGFAFAHAPPTDVRVRADAGDLGVGWGWASFGERRTHVMVVIRTGGSITVTAGAEVRGRARVRCRDPYVFGADTAWLGNRRGRMETAEQWPEVPDVPHRKVFEQHILRSYLEHAYPEHVPDGLDALAPAQARVALDEALSAGLDTLTGFEAIEAEFDKLAAFETAMRKEHAAAIEADDARWDEGLVADPGRDDPRERYTIVAEAPLGTPMELPAGHVYELEVLPDGAPPRREPCGSVRLDPGDDLRVACGVEQTAVLTGRIVDDAGAPLVSFRSVDEEGRFIEMVGTRVQVEWSAQAERWPPEKVSATVGEDGRFRLEVPLTHPATLSLKVGVDDANTQSNMVLRAVRLLPGERRELGDVLFPYSDQHIQIRAHRVAAGAFVVDDGGGMRLDDIVAGGAFEQAGLEYYDRVLAIDGRPTTELPPYRVGHFGATGRGETATLRVRNQEGFEYDVVIPRAALAYQPEVARPDDEDSEDGEDDEKGEDSEHSESDDTLEVP